MFKIVIGTTYAERSKTIGISKEEGFTKVIEKLTEIQDDLNLACIIETSLDELKYLFGQTEIVEGSASGNVIYIDDSTLLCKEVSGDITHKIDTAEKAWLRILFDINEDIDELFRYGASDMREDVVYLKNILMFLSYTLIYENEEQFIRWNVR